MSIPQRLRRPGVFQQSVCAAKAVLALSLFLTLPLIAGNANIAKRTHFRVPVSTDAEDVEKKDFKVTLDGAESKILKVRGPADDLVLILVLDLTGDVTQIEAARQALADTIVALPANTWIAVLRAQDGTKALSDPTNDREKTIAAIREAPITGKAGFLEAVETVSRLGDAIMAKTAVRAAAVYITDSNVSNYREDFTNPVINSSDSRDLSRVFGEGLVSEKIRKLEAAISSSESPLYFVHLEYRADRLNEAYQTGMLQLAPQTGGAGLFCRSIADVPGAVSKMLRAAASHWSVDVDLTKVKNRSVQVQLENGGRPLTYRTRIVLK